MMLTRYLLQSVLFFCVAVQLYAAPVPPTSLTFNLFPREINSVNGRNSIRLAAVLSPLFNVANAEVVASLKHKKVHFAYSKPLKKFIKKMGIDPASFKPLETYLTGQVRAAKKSPAIAVAMLNAYLANGISPSFAVLFAEQPIVDASSLSSASTLPEMLTLKTALTESVSDVPPNPEMLSLESVTVDTMSLSDVTTSPEMLSLGSVTVDTMSVSNVTTGPEMLTLNSANKSMKTVIPVKTQNTTNQIADHSMQSLLPIPQPIVRIDDPEQADLLRTQTTPIQENEFEEGSGS
jgi:hypothetical protein